MCHFPREGPCPTLGLNSDRCITWTMSERYWAPFICEVKMLQLLSVRIYLLSAILAFIVRGLVLISLKLVVDNFAKGLKEKGRTFVQVAEEGDLPRKDLSNFVLHKKAVRK